MKLDKARVMRLIKAALKEDIGDGDITTEALVPRRAYADGTITANEECVLCGIMIAGWILGALDRNIRFKPLFHDGQLARAGDDVALVKGHARAILMAERLILNFISFLSGIATETRRYADKAARYGVKILDTRKTVPLMRYLQKYAVTVGGGASHRMNLSSMAMIKDNHIKFIDGGGGVRKLRTKLRRKIKIEAEVENLKDFKSVLESTPDIIMLDNMRPDDIRKAVRLRNKRKRGKKISLEASGGITLENVERYAVTGVDSISIGALTDTVGGVDFSFNLL